MLYIEPTTKVWLKTKEGLFLFPINPPKIELTRSVPQDKFQIIGKGEITIPKKPNLRTIKWSSFLPGDTSGYLGVVQSPTTFVEVINNLMDQGEVCELIIKRKIGGDTSINVVITAFSPSDNGGTPNDVDYTIEFIEWRDYSPTIIDVKVKDKKAKGTKNKQRKAEAVITVGAKVVANGKYYYDSYGSEPHGTANNLSTYIKRIVPGRAYPVLIGNNIGWIKEANLQVKG